MAEDWLVWLMQRSCMMTNNMLLTIHCFLRRQVYHFMILSVPCNKLSCLLPGNPSEKKELQTAMKASDLNNFLQGISTVETLKQIIEEEVSTYKELMNNKGSAIAISFDEDEETVLDSPAIKKLLQETLSENLSNIYLAYICDCLTLGENVDFKDVLTHNIVFEIADPEINGGYKTKAELNQLIERLN